MSYEIKELSAVSKEISFVVTAERVDAYLTRACQSVNQKAKLKGFRPGKIPRQMLEQHYGQEINQRALEKLMSEVVFEALDELKIAPAMKPSVDSEKPLLAGHEFTFKATVETLPEIAEVTFEGLEAKLPERPEVGEEQILEQLENMRTRMASFKPIEDRKVAQEGDYVDFSYVEACKAEDHAGHDHKPHERFIELGKGTFFTEKPEIEKALIGAELGKPVEIGDLTMTVNIIKECIKPDLDDEFAKDCSDKFESLEQLKADIKENLTKQRADQVETDKKEGVLDALIAKNPIDIPEGLVMKQAEEMAIQNVSRFPKEMALKFFKSYGKQMMDNLKPAAAKMLKSHLLMQQIAKQQNREFKFDEMMELVLGSARIS
ncbi:MAG: trigger factor [Deltaproteobacteria bacterium]|nr:trigger factor [Deltaproteobacteria bacterium]